jgi:putative transposase
MASRGCHRRLHPHGTITLPAALGVAPYKVIIKSRTLHRHQEFLGFLRQIETSLLEDLDVHLIVDNYCTHKHPLDQRSSAKR